jgi:SAM-dependent methyltransferase
MLMMIPCRSLIVVRCLVVAVVSFCDCHSWRTPLSQLRQLLLWLPSPTCSSSAAAFLPFPVAQRRRRRQHRPAFVKERLSLAFAQGAAAHGGGANDFDFSSTRAWETFYQQQQANKRSKNDHDDDDDDAKAAATTIEWHSSISMQTLVDLIPKSGNDSNGEDNEKSKKTKRKKKRLLMIGCGTSMLPTYIQSQRPASDLVITLLDSSPTCIQQLQQRYGDSMHYICGDATRLSNFHRRQRRPTHEYDDDQDMALVPLYYDYIYDKGLLDALLCNEGWNTAVARLVHEASRVLKSPSSSTSSSTNGDDGGGLYILVSYPLPTSTREFLMQQGDLVGLQWQFDIESSIQNNNSSNSSCNTSSSKAAPPRVSISMAQKVVSSTTTTTSSSSWQQQT